MYESSNANHADAENDIGNLLASRIMHAMMRTMLRASVCLAVLLLGCTPPPSVATAPDIAPAQLALVESEPTETTLDRPDIPNASDVWLDLFRHAQRSIDIAQFYASDAEPQWLASSKLTPLIDALGEAQKRGVKVRFLLDEKFVPQYGATLNQLKNAGLEVRRINGDAIFGGVQHAKYFIVDGSTSFIGSQNFDWRALDHIQEVGLRIHSREIATLLLEIFETDWAFAGGAPYSTRIQHATPMGKLPGIEGQQVQFVASPKGWLPDEESWDLPRIVDLLDEAKQSIDVQVLKYKTTVRAGDHFRVLDDALRRAAARGVHIRLLVSEWGMKDSSLQALRTLGPYADLRVIKIPQWSGGAIPFARVAHAKYLVVDGRAVWLGTSNWEGDYFTKSRNVGIILRDGQTPARLAKFFEENWSSSYVVPLPTEFTPIGDQH